MGHTVDLPTGAAPVEQRTRTLEDDRPFARRSCDDRLEHVRHRRLGTRGERGARRRERHCVADIGHVGPQATRLKGRGHGDHGGRQVVERQERSPQPGASRSDRRRRDSPATAAIGCPAVIGHIVTGAGPRHRELACLAASGRRPSASTLRAKPPACPPERCPLTARYRQFVDSSGGSRPIDTANGPAPITR